MVPGNVKDISDPRLESESERRRELSEEDFITQWFNETHPQFMRVYIPKWKPPDGRRSKA